MHNPYSLQPKCGYLKLNLFSLFGNKRWPILWYPYKLLSYQHLPASFKQEMHYTDEPFATAAADRYSKVLMMLFMEEIEVFPPLIWEQTLVKTT